MKYEELLAIWRQYIQESDAIAEYNRKLSIILSTFTKCAEIVNLHPEYVHLLTWFVLCVETHHLPLNCVLLREDKVVLRLSDYVVLYITPTQVEYYDELRDVRVVEEDVNDTRVLEVYLKCDFDVRAGVTPGPDDLIVDLRKWSEECKNGN